MPSTVPRTRKQLLDVVKPDTENCSPNSPKVARDWEMLFASTTGLLGRCLPCVVGGARPSCHGFAPHETEESWIFLLQVSSGTKRPD